MKKQTFEQQLKQTSPQVNELHQKALLSDLVGQWNARPKNPTNSLIWTLNWNMLRNFAIIILCCILILPASIKITRAISTCGIDQVCITKYWTTTNFIGNQVEASQYSDGSSSIATNPLTKDQCIEVMKQLKATLINTSEKLIEYQLPSGHKISCEIKEDGTWDADLTKTSTLERDNFQRIIFGNAFTNEDAISSMQYYYQEEASKKFTNEEIASLLTKYGVKFVESADGCDYYQMPNPRYKLSWCKRNLYIELIDLEGKTMPNKEDKVFQDLITFIEKQ